MAKILPVYQQNYLNKYRKPQDSLITSMENYASSHKIPILNWHAAEFLEQLIQIHNPGKVLEIGMAIGYSTIRIARNLAEKGIIHTLEKSTNNITLAKDFIARSGVEKKIKIIEGDALDIIPELNGKYDFIFLDADKEDYAELFKSSLSKLNSQGIILIDNLLWQGLTASPNVPVKLKRSTEHIREFNRLFMNTDELDTTIIAIGDGIGLGIKKVRH